MAAKKTPNYDEMSLEELNAAAGEHMNAIRELRKGDGGLDTELSVAEHQAHLRVINPLRTELSVRDEMSRSDMVRRMRGMSKSEWQRLTQVINSPDAIAEGEVHAPGAKAN